MRWLNHHSDNPYYTVHFGRGSVIAYAKEPGVSKGELLARPVATAGQKAAARKKGISNKPGPSLVELIDVSAELEKRKINVSREVEYSTRCLDFTIIGLDVKDSDSIEYNLSDYIDDIEALCSNAESWVDSLKEPEQQKRLFDNRVVGDEMVATLKRANIILQNACQFNSILEKVLAHRLNWMRSTDSDGLGRKGIKAKSGSIIETDAGIYEVVDGVMILKESKQRP